MQGFKRTSVVSTSTDESEGSGNWERPTPAEGWSIDKAGPAKYTSGPLIRNMLNNLNPEKD